MSLTARISSPGKSPARWEGEPDWVWRMITRPGRTLTTEPKPFDTGALHLPELLELIAIEEHRVRVEHAQHAGNRAAVNRLVQGGAGRPSSRRPSHRRRGNG